VAGARWQLDVLFSILFTVLAAVQLGPKACASLNVSQALPCLGHAAFAALPAAAALTNQAWWFPGPV
jgi:hypothetical protein